jgi:hypothetical protein
MAEWKPRQAFTSVIAGIVTAFAILLLGGWWMTSFVHPRQDVDRFPTNDTLPAAGISIPVQPTKNE